MYRTIVCIAAVITTMPASAQSIRDQLVGTWRLVSCRDPIPACAKPNAIAVYDASGHYVFMSATLDRPKVSGSPLGASPAEEIKAIQPGFAANFGTWTYNEADKIMTFHVEGAFFPNIVGNDNKGNPLVSVTADELRFVGPYGETVFQRVSK
jgi:Lipocalin-like domain